MKRALVWMIAAVLLAVAASPARAQGHAAGSDADGALSPSVMGRDVTRTVALEGDTAPGADTVLTTRIELDGQPVTDLEPYLGAFGHLVAIRSGDLGYLDADGYLYIADRLKDMIISGGENIYPAEIERVLHEHPAVAEAAVIGCPDPKWQEVPVAYVVVRKGMAVDADGLLRHVAAQLARFKIPRDVVFVDDLPRNALGKVQHFRLKELAKATR